MNAAQRRKQRRLPKKEAFKAKLKADKIKKDGSAEEPRPLTTALLKAVAL